MTAGAAFDVDPLRARAVNDRPVRHDGDRARLGLAVAAAGLALLLQGCFSVQYVAQAAGGELAMLHAARPIRDVLADDRVPERTRRLLGMVRSVKAFGQTEGLKPTRSYESYADLGRPAAVWVVQACAPLAFDQKHWSFPVVGTVPYLGFFDEGRARRYADALARDQGLDVEVRTAGAYSTLGWFHDPVLSTMIGRGEEALGDLADTVLHESVHATVYLNDQSTFNESLATFVADGLAPVWLERALGPEAPEAVAWRKVHAERQARVARLHALYVALDALYRSPASDAEKRAGKARLLEAAQEELHLNRPLNNAALAGYRTYEAGLPALERLLAACGGSWPRLLRSVETLRPRDFGRPQQEDVDEVVDRLARQRCAG